MFEKLFIVCRIAKPDSCLPGRNFLNKPFRRKEGASPYMQANTLSPTCCSLALAMQTAGSSVASQSAAEFDMGFVPDDIFPR